MYIVNNEELAELVIMMRFAPSFCNGERDRKCGRNFDVLVVVVCAIGYQFPSRLNDENSRGKLLSLF